MLHHRLTCEHPKKDLANRDRFVETVQQNLFGSTLRSWRTGYIQRRTERILDRGQTRESIF
jgi:hypothetical protein